MARYRSTTAHGSLQKYNCTWLATEVQANMPRYRSGTETCEVMDFELPWHNETLLTVTKDETDN